MGNSFVIGVAGGSGSGKTTVSRRIRESVNVENIAYLEHDNYYRDQSHLTLEQRVQTNYDHPNSLETELLVAHVRALQAGQTIDMPLYDFAIHTRSQETRRIAPARIILVEGILIYAEKDLRELMDIRIFVDTDADIRFIRRLRRDMGEARPLARLRRPAVHGHRAAHAPGVCRAEQALRRRHRPPRRQQPGGDGNDRQPHSGVSGRIAGRASERVRG
jgi:uridine kinase